MISKTEQPIVIESSLKEPTPTPPDEEVLDDIIPAEIMLEATVVLDQDISKDKG